MNVIPGLWPPEDALGWLTIAALVGCLLVLFGLCIARLLRWRTGQIDLQLTGTTFSSGQLVEGDLVLFSRRAQQFEAVSITLRAIRAIEYRRMDVPEHPLVSAFNTVYEDEVILRQNAQLNARETLVLRFCVKVPAQQHRLASPPPALTSTGMKDEITWELQASATGKGASLIHRRPLEISGGPG